MNVESAVLIKNHNSRKLQPRIEKEAPQWDGQSCCYKWGAQNCYYDTKIFILIFLCKRNNENVHVHFVQFEMNILNILNMNTKPTEINSFYTSFFFFLFFSFFLYYIIYIYILYYKKKEIKVRKKKEIVLNGFRLSHAWKSMSYDTISTLPF